MGLKPLKILFLVPLSLPGWIHLWMYYKNIYIYIYLQICVYLKWRAQLQSALHIIKLNGCSLSIVIASMPSTFCQIEACFIKVYHCVQQFPGLNFSAHLNSEERENNHNNFSCITQCINPCGVQQCFTLVKSCSTVPYSKYCKSLLQHYNTVNVKL